MNTNAQQAVDHLPPREMVHARTTSPSDVARAHMPASSWMPGIASMITDLDPRASATGSTLIPDTFLRARFSAVLAGL
jgi:hypothetical protein